MNPSEKQILYHLGKKKIFNGHILSHAYHSSFFSFYTTTNNFGDKSYNVTHRNTDKILFKKHTKKNAQTYLYLNLFSDFPSLSPPLQRAWQIQLYLQHPVGSSLIIMPIIVSKVPGVSSNSSRLLLPVDINWKSNYPRTEWARMAKLSPGIVRSVESL